MTVTELRELDVWIAEHVMGLLRTEKPDEWTDHDKALFWYQQDGTYNRTMIGRAWLRRNVEGPRYDHSWSTFQPTTDPAAALEVLKKCIEKISKRAIEPMDDSDFKTEFSIMLRLGYEDKGGFALRGLRTWFDTYSADELAESETLEITICLLAKELYSK